MIMKGGLTSLLRGFSAPIKDAFKISHLELGNDTGGEDPPVPVGYNTPLSEFNKVYTMQLSHEDFSVVDYKTLKLELSLDGYEMIEEEDGFLKFSSIRLVCGNGEVFAWRRFPPSILVSGYVATLEWDIVLDEVCWNGGVIDPPEVPPEEEEDATNFKVKTTDGEILELDLTNVEQVEEWLGNNYISIIEGIIDETTNHLKVELESVEEVISYGGAQIHTNDGVIDISGYQLGTPNLIKIPDYLPEWVTSMFGFLLGASKFNQPLDNLDTSNVTTMDYFLYGATSFDQPLNLDTSKVTTMGGFLYNASSFNQDLSHLCVPLIKSEPYNFAYGATVYTEPRPVWGTCPGTEEPGETLKPLAELEVKFISPVYYGDYFVVYVDNVETHRVEYDGSNFTNTVMFNPPLRNGESIYVHIREDNGSLIMRYGYIAPVVPQE